MRILHIMWNMNIGGAERAVYQLIREQRENSIDSNILVLNKSGYYAGLLNKEFGNVRVLGTEKQLTPGSKKDFMKILTDYTAIHFHSAEFRYIAHASKNREIKKYYTHRAGIHNFTLKQKIRHKVTGFYLRKYFTAFSSNTIHAGKSAAGVYKIPQNKFLLTYNGIDFSLLMPRLPKESIQNKLFVKNNIVIGTTANIRKWKRIDILIKLMQNFKEENIKLLIVGDGPEKEGLKILARNLGVHNNVIFVSKAENIADYLQIMDIFILPSNEAESFGNSAVEAMGFGIPTLVFQDGGGLTEHIIDKQTGYIVKNNEELLYVTKELINNKTLREEIGAAGKAHVRSKYNLKQMVDSYNKLYGLN